MEAPAPAPLRLRLFGTPLLCDDAAASPLALPAKSVALLALLAIEHDRPHLRSRLAERLWPDVTDEGARANLRRHLHLLAHTLPANALILTKNGVQWNHAALDADVIFFLTSSSDPQHLRSAVSLWNGELCAGIHDDALEEGRTVLARRYASMLRTLFEASRDEGDATACTTYLERLCAFDPLDERTIRALMEVRTQTGDRAGALREYNALVQRLRIELETEPEQATMELFRRILYGDATAAAAHNFIPFSTSFVGREIELDAIAQALKTYRVISLTGPAGVGKTRLACRSAMNHLGAYPGGVWFVDVSVARSRAELRARTAQVLETARSAGTAIDAKRLLILDNCEHVLEEAREFVDELLAETTTQFLVTSRQRLSCASEHVIPVAPLPVPPELTAYRADEIAQYSAARLLLERAVTVAPSFRINPENAHALVDVLRRLDGLPLAIELVAARANLLTMEGIRKRLDDRSRAFANRAAPSRHTTLNDALAWSVELLSDQERLLFERVAVFPSSFDMEAAEAICGDGRVDVVATLSELVEASLVGTILDGDSARYSLLVTTRSFASLYLQASGEWDAVRYGHARYFATIAEALRKIDASEVEERINALRSDLGNFVAALEWCIESGDFAIGSRLVAGVARYMTQYANCRQYLSLSERFLEQVAASQPPSEALALCYRAAGILSNTCTEWGRARRYNERARDIFAAIGNHRAASNAQAALAAAEIEAGNFEKAERLLLDVLSEQEHLDDRNTLGRTLNFLGALYLSTGRLEEARIHLTRCLEVFRALGDMNNVSVALKNLALVEYHAGDLRAATERIEAALALRATHHDVLRFVDAVNLQGTILRRQGRLPQALGRHADALEHLVRLEECRLIADVLEDVAHACAEAGDAHTATLAAGVASSIRSRLGAPMDPVTASSWDELGERLRFALGPDAFQTIFGRGAGAARSTVLAEITAAVRATARAPVRFSRLTESQPDSGF
ncbi:MAG: AfsR/SARP family transcriptional regulator [Candidatus Tyrphobacter sp.]